MLPRGRNRRTLRSGKGASHSSTGSARFHLRGVVGGSPHRARAEHAPQGRGRASALDGQSFSLAGQELWRCRDAPCALRQGGPHASELCAWRGSDGEILRVFYYNKKILGKTH